MKPYFSDRQTLSSGAELVVNVAPRGAPGPTPGDDGVLAGMISLPGVLGALGFLVNRGIFRGQWKVVLEIEESQRSKVIETSICNDRDSAVASARQLLNQYSEELQK